MQATLTSVLAFREAVEEGRAECLRDVVFLWLRENGPATRQEIARGTGIPINIVCPRVRELLNEERVFVAGTRPCRVTGKTAQVLEAWRV